MYKTAQKCIKLRKNQTPKGRHLWKWKKTKIKMIGRQKASKVHLHTKWYPSITTRIFCIGSIGSLKERHAASLPHATDYWRCGTATRYMHGMYTIYRIGFLLESMCNNHCTWCIWHSPRSKEREREGMDERVKRAHNPRICVMHVQCTARGCTIKHNGCNNITTSEHENLHAHLVVRRISVTANVACSASSELLAPAHGCCCCLCSD